MDKPVAIEGFSTTDQARLVFYQSGRFVHAPFGVISADYIEGLGFTPTGDLGTAAFENYVSGTWSPSLISAGGDFSGAGLNVLSAEYVSIGRAVHVALSYALTGIGTGSLANPSRVRIGGLPVTPAERGATFDYVGTGVIFRSVGSMQQGQLIVGISNLASAIDILALPANANDVLVSSEQTVEILYYSA